MGVLFSVFSVMFSFVLAPSIVAVFIKASGTKIALYSAKVLKICVLSFIPASFNIVIGGYFTAVERAVRATVISLTRSILALVLSLVVLTAILGGAGIWWTPLATEGICLILTIVMYRR